MNRDDLLALARLRLEEARALLAAERPHGAYYLAGYAVECLLKARVARETREHDYPDKVRTLQVWTHDLRALLRVSRLDAELDVLERNDVDVQKNRRIVTRWTEASRYDRQRTIEEARALIQAIGDHRSGILRVLWTSC